MGWGIQWIVDKITFPSPPSSYSLTSHPDLFFIKNPSAKAAGPGIPCMMYAIPQGAPVILVHAHSNGCDIGDMRQTLQSISESLRVHVMSFEYPGYGLNVGSPNMRVIDEAANAVLNYLLKDLNINPAQIVWYGRSIGSGPATRIVHRLTKEHKVNPGGLIIQCGFANFKEVAGFLFGRWAKRFVSPLWPNEAMVKDLNCPVLIIHGRADKMIPISQAEQLWKVVQQKDQSKFHTCDCGHNDFNFQLCTLRPIYEFLVRVISTPGFPAQNFKVEIDPARRSFVRHIGPLQSRIPVYTFRRPELEEWMKALQAKKLQSVDVAAGKNMVLDASAEAPGDAKTGMKLDMTASPKGGPEAEDEAGPRLAAGKEDLGSADETGSASPKQPPAPVKDRKSKGKEAAEKKKAEVFEIPNYCELPPVTDPSEALGTSEGMLRLCAARVERYLERVQQHLNDVDGLESKPVTEIVEFVESEFWAADPLLCLWAEISLPKGEVSRFRLGPFFVNNSGEAGQDDNLPGLPSEDLLRVPLWTFSLSAAHFRYLAEWSLLHSERIMRTLPERGSSSCCAPCCCGRGSSSKSAGSRRKKADSKMQHPCRGVLSTLLAAHFVNWVEKNEEIRLLISKFAELHQRPEDAFRLHAATAAMSQPLAGGVPELAVPLAEEVSTTTPPNAVVGAQPLPQERVSYGRGLTVPKPPWHARTFADMGRDFLGDRLGSQSVLLEAALLQLWGVEDVDGMFADGKPMPAFGDCAAALETLSRPAPERSLDWVVANVLLHYDRVLRPPAADAKKGLVPVDALRPEAQTAGLAINRAMRAFVHAKQRERRELERRKLRNPPTPHKVATVAARQTEAAPDSAVLDMDPPPPATAELPKDPPEGEQQALENFSKAANDARRTL